MRFLLFIFLFSFQIFSLSSWAQLREPEAQIILRLPPSVSVYWTDDEPYLEVLNEVDRLALYWVNKERSIRFSPDDLIDIGKSSEELAYFDKTGLKLRYFVVDPIGELIKEAKTKGYMLGVLSAYRDQEYQHFIFNRSVNKNGPTHAERYSARPGHSEHQLGTTADIVEAEEWRPNPWPNLSVESPTMKWLRENAHKHGFVMSYPKEAEEVTGYAYEPWHFRYVGKTLAKFLFEENLTLEQFFKMLFYINDLKKKNRIQNP